MIAIVLGTALLTVASAQTCVSDNRLKPLTTADFRAREEIQGFSKDGMWKMPKLAQHATEEQLEDCASCTDAEVQVEIMQAQMGENPLLNEIDGIYYPVENKYAPNGFKLSYKDIPHEAPAKVKQLLEHRAGSLEIEVSGYRQFTEGDAERVAKNHEELQHLAPAGLGPFFQEARTADKKKPALIVKAAQKALAEYASHVRVLRDIEKSSTKGSGVYVVLKEGFVMAQNFKSQYRKVLNEAPKDWDVLFLSTGPSKNHMTRCEDKIAGLNLYEMRRPVTTPDGIEKFYAGGIDGYIVRKQSLPKILSMLRHTKAAPLNELLMSVHTEEKERLSNGKINYKVEGIYSYMVTDKMLDTVALPKAPAPQPKVEVKDKKQEKQEDKKVEKKEDKKVEQKTSKFLQTV
eukprot:gnl/MRDRNA2_/MRDRNA2_82276_c0_seq1.p1 gnl/MRDRNA2_/MRDRNA2_82276_c0~~gnl/MRDRNA2_/MRDRNA2_82276_c0_seq1.p1  ORF type:complete len:403 (-),score=105.95 gnl/MRDRNA2_/MRDRNA2_82276_c0_seq1:52-1260(-)